MTTQHRTIYKCDGSGQLCQELTESINWLVPAGWQVLTLRWRSEKWGDITKDIHYCPACWEASALSDIVTKAEGEMYGTARRDA